MSDKPHVPNTNDINGEPEEDKSTHIPLAPYPHCNDPHKIIQVLNKFDQV